MKLEVEGIFLWAFENFQRTWMSEVEREALREMEWEEEHRRIMEEVDRVLEENARIRKMLGAE